MCQPANQFPRGWLYQTWWWQRLWMPCCNYRESLQYTNPCVTTRVKVLNTAFPLCPPMADQPEPSPRIQAVFSQYPFWRDCGRTKTKSLSVILLHILFSPLISSANELTIGKVYAALMIFDYYKQNRAKRLQQQQQQQGASGSQVRHTHHNSLRTLHTYWMNLCKPLSMVPHWLCLHAYTNVEDAFVSTSHSLVDYEIYQKQVMFLV